MNVGAVERFYDRFAGMYDLVFGQVFHDGRAKAVRAMGLPPGGSVLEIGVGTGLNVPLYPQHVRVVGIDLSAKMLQEARRRIGRHDALSEIQLARMDATRLGFPDDAFDAVYAPYVVSVVPSPRNVVAEMVRVCRPGGRVVILNHFESRHPVGRWLERRLTPLTHHVGFRLDLPVESVLGVPGLAKLEERRVNVLKLWRLLVFEKIGSGGVGSARSAAVRSA
ncbi:MAG: methyltransferase domain-containing protein [Acidobacteriota bacterium]|nr:methyltransferase domain-containing protein [Acidobacteriota bacterium]